MTNNEHRDVFGTSMCEKQPGSDSQNAIFTTKKKELNKAVPSENGHCGQRVMSISTSL